MNFNRYNFQTFKQMASLALVLAMFIFVAPALSQLEGALTPKSTNDPKDPFVILLQQKYLAFRDAREFGKVDGMLDVSSQAQRAQLDSITMLLESAADDADSAVPDFGKEIANAHKEHKKRLIEEKRYVPFRSYEFVRVDVGGQKARLTYEYLDRSGDVSFIFVMYTLEEGEWRIDNEKVISIPWVKGKKRAHAKDFFNARELAIPVQQVVPDKMVDSILDD